MTVCFEFLSIEPLENTAAFLNYRFDKAVYFGSRELIKRKQKYTDSFLKKYCAVRKVKFIAIPSDNLEEILKIMGDSIVKEIAESNDIYFDITGGESLALVAFGILSEKYDTPMHKFDIINNECIDLKPGASRHITKDVPARRVELTIEKYVEMRGGIVDLSRQKDYKNPDSKGFTENTNKLWRIAKRHMSSWNHFCGFFRSNFHPADNLQVSEKIERIENSLRKVTDSFEDDAEFYHILNELVQADLLTDYSKENGLYSFKIKNQFVKDCLWDSGSVLELHTYQLLENSSDDCGVGVHLDWNAETPDESDTGVLNEIDVMCMNGNISTFVSCKTGISVREALYELDTVTRRFGGKYARKALAVTRDISEADERRAKEMRIRTFKIE